MARRALTIDDVDDAENMAGVKFVPNAAPIHKRVRLSVDIDPEPYRNLVAFCQDVALKLGRARINHVAVLREVIVELLSDKGLQTRVINRVNDTLTELDRLKAK